MNEKCLLFFFQLSCIYFFNKFSLISYLKAKKKKKTKTKNKTQRKTQGYILKKIAHNFIFLQIRITDRQNCEQNIDVTYKFVVDKMSMDGIFGLFEAVFAFLVSL